MKAVVLVGGEGTRLRPLTYSTPKPLLPIANQAFLERQLAWLAGHGVTEVILSLGYLPDAFREHFPSGEFAGIRISYAIEPEPLGTAGGIRFAAEGVDERIIVCNGDVLTDLDLTALVAFHESRDAAATIALTRVEDPSAFGVVPTRDDGQVIAFVEKPPPGQAPTDWINAGTYVLEPRVLQRIPPRLPVSIERVTFPRMLEDRAGLYAVPSTSYWLDIGTPDKYLRGNLDVIDGRIGAVPVAGAEEVTPGVWVQADATVHPDADLQAPALVGVRAEIAAGATVRASVVGAGAMIGAGARVIGSVVLDRGEVGADAQLAAAVVGVGAVVGAGSRLSDHTMLGAGTSVTAGSRLVGERVAPPGFES